LAKGPVGDGVQDRDNLLGSPELVRA
jgi:hypothetical protein